MDVKEAVQKAMEHAQTLFSEEKISNLGLEEVEFDEENNKWLVTIGFSRPWDYSTTAFSVISSPPPPKRSYKVITIDYMTGEVVSIKNR